MEIYLKNHKNISHSALNLFEERQKEVFQKIIEPYTGSNRYTVSIYLSSYSNSIVAKVSNSSGKEIIVPRSKIVNGLTNKVLDEKKIMGICQTLSGSFRPIYLPQTGNVYIWPHMLAAGQEHYRTTYLVTDNKNNPFLNKSIEQCLKHMESGNFIIPGTIYTVPEDSFKHRPNDRDRYIFRRDEKIPMIIVMGGSSRLGGEPAHIEVIYENAENEQGKHDCLKFPLTDPKIDPEWSRRIGAKGFQECKEVPSDITKQSPDGKPRGGGDGGGTSGPGSGSGGGGNSGSEGGSTAGFNNNLNHNGLTDSYNSTNSTNPMARGNATGDIGGVAIHEPNAVMLNMHSSLYDLTATGYWLAFPTKTEIAPFNNKELQQITRELAQTIYLHNTFPFYSLHFTKQGTLYSVIHPAYQNTLVGKVIAMLDYFMKGYLNGGYFNETDLEKFSKNKDSWINNYDALTPAIRSIEGAHQQTCPDGEYISLSELIEGYQIKQYNFLDRLLSNLDIKKIEQRFQISFRIIAKEDSIEKEFNTLLFNSSFDVLYTIEINKSAIGESLQYEESEEYKLLEQFCKYVANDIKEKLPKLDICKTYFAMLDVICGISYHFSTLKKHELMPSFSPVEVDCQEKCLGLFPPYPKTKLEEAVQEHNLWEFLKDLPDSDLTQLNGYLSGQHNQISPELQTSLVEAIKRILPKNSVKLGANAFNELVLYLLNSSLSSINSFKNKVISGEYKNNRGELVKKRQKDKDEILELKKVIEENKAELSECLIALDLRKNKDIEELIEEIEKNNLTKLNMLRVQAEKEILEIDQIRIDLNKYMIYEDMYYDFYSEHALKKAMRNNLYKELESKYKIIEDNANQITKDVKVKIELYYEKEKNDLENQYQCHILDVQKIINNIKKRRTDCKTEIARLLNIEQHILNNPTAIDVAKSVRLMVPLITKKLSTLAFEESTVVRVSGGTGFQLNNKRISSTALVRSLGDKLNDSYVNSLDKLDKENYTQRIENWQPISFNNQHYHAFFVSHHHSDESHTKDLELSIQKPLMAKTLDEKRLLKLAAQKPNAEQIEEIRILITGGVHLDKTDAYGNTAQHLAAMNDNVGLLKVLLIYCKGTITQNRFGNYPVHIAAMYGHDAALEVLLKNDNENARAITMNDESALYLTVLHHNLSTTKLLIDYGSDINETGINGLPLIYTSLFNGSEKITDYLLEIPDIILNFQLEDGNTLLHAAVKLNQVDLVRKLVKKNLNLNVTNKNGQSPFHIAVELGYFDIIKLLLNFNRSILEEVDSSGYPPLYLAIKHGHPPVCNYLLTMGATYSKLVNKGNALTLALQFRQVNCARKILEHCNYHIDIDDGVDLDNFHTICKLGLWELARVIVETNPKALLKEFKVIKEHELIEPTCYIEYLCKANAYSQFNSLMRLPATALRASGYVKENLRKIYQISIASASEEILRCLVKYNMTNPLANSDKIFGPQEAQSWLYREYDLIQYAFRKNIGLFHSNYLKNKDVDIERTTTDNKNLVYLAAESGNKNLLKILIDRNAQLYAPNGRHIFYALVTNNRSTIIRELVLRYDIDINIIIDKNNGMRAIDLACKLGNIDTILDLIACGGQIDEPNTVNKLAIHYAIQSNALHVTRLIFKYELGGLEPMLRFAILHHKNAVFDQIISNQDNYVSQILACSNELLVVAIEAGNLYVVKLLLGMGAKPDNSLLHLAVKYNQNLTLRLLLATEIDVNSVDSDSNTALHLACKNGNDLIILELIKHKQLNKKLYNNQRKLANELASEWIRNVVLNNNLDVIGKNLVKIIQDGSLSKFKSLISSYKIPINSKVSYTHNGNSAYFSLLEVAIFENNNIVIEYLLEQSGANPTEINSSGLTAVHLLMKLSDAQFVVSMIEKFNLDIHISNSVNGITPLHFAVLANNPALINYLITHGADIYAEESNSETIIELAIEHNSPELVKLLIEEHNYDLHHKSNILESPLAIALKTGNLAIAQYLVSKGADIFSIDGFNCRSMLHYAVLSENIKVVHYALTLGIDERIQDSKHMLALHLAAKQGNVDIVELLSNSNPLLLRATDMRGRNANDFALIHLKKEVSSYISKRYGNIFKDKPTFENAIRFKKYRHGGRSQLELAIIAEDQTNIERLIITVNPTDSNAIESAICYAAASANPTIFIYILNQLWNQVDHKVIRKSMMSAIVNNRTANLKEILKIIGSEIILEDGCSPIELACKYTTPEVLRCLLDYNHDNFIQPSAENIYLALKSTIDNNSITQAKMLIESCDTCWEGVVDSSGNSLLHHAVAKNRAQMLALFIMCGAEDKRNYAGNTARHLAHKDGKNECLKYLKFGSYDNSVKSRSIKIKNTGLNKYMEENEGTLDYELFQWLCSFQNVNLTNSEGKTPLHVAIKNRDRRAIEILLSSGANTLIEDKNGCSVLKKACDTDLRILKMVFPNLLKNPEGLNIAFEELCSNKEYNGLKELRKILSSQKMLNKKDPTQLFQDIRLGKTSLYTIFLYEEALAGSENILHLALDMNEVSLCEFIIMNSLVLDKNFNVKDAILAHDKYGHTVIHRAITLNHPDFLRNILAQLSREEADPEDMDYISPIVFAMCRNRRDCFKLLSDHGAKVEKNFKWSSLYKQLPHLWCGVQEIDADDIQRLIDIESLEGFFEEIMKFSHNSLCEKYSQIIYSMAQRRHPIEGSQYFMMIAGKTNDKDVYEYFELLAKYLPLKLLEIKSSTWYLSDFPTLFTMAYANDNSHLFNYFLESGENPYWVLDSSLVVENGLKVHSIYNLWYGDRLAELSRKLNSDLKFTKMHELARIFISLIGQSKPRINKYHSECWKNIFVLLLRGIDQLGIKPIIFLEYFDKALNSVITVENLSVHSTKEVNFVMEEISKNKLFNDFFLGKQRLSKEKLEDCIIS